MVCNTHRMYYLYIVRCADGTLYTGIAQNLKKRISRHNDSDLGAKYTKSRRPVELVYSRRCMNRSTALRAEARIKQFSRTKKLALMQK